MIVWSQELKKCGFEKEPMFEIVSCHVPGEIVVKVYGFYRHTKNDLSRLQLTLSDIFPPEFKNTIFRRA